MLADLKLKSVSARRKEVSVHGKWVSSECSGGALGAARGRSGEIGAARVRSGALGRARAARPSIPPTRPRRCEQSGAPRTPGLGARHGGVSARRCGLRRTCRDGQRGNRARPSPAAAARRPPSCVTLTRPQPRPPTGVQPRANAREPAALSSPDPHGPCRVVSSASVIVVMEPVCGAACAVPLARAPPRSPRPALCRTPLHMQPALFKIRAVLPVFGV
ncbi:hypothetical protein MSG28_003711 [Choristoneura fumiferana]|uniref:Uncharacterized protein n=1 Tax=Choristoneura fumiferana TaxID=7141 RepID=A0ACC0KFX5_CHOFU|nr:hypothetical protein MSG28_003711 [Choristoneura fumiferana]